LPQGFVITLVLCIAVGQGQGQGQGRKHPLASQPPTQRNYSRTSSTSRVGQQAGGNVSNNAARKMLSAGRLKINELRNKVTELTVQLANVQTENKQLLRQQRQQVTDSYQPASVTFFTVALANVNQFY